MKTLLTRHKTLITLICILLSFRSVAQQLTVQLTAYDYYGYNTSAFGLSDGGITTYVIGGTPPYHYFWSTKDTTQNIYNLAAGYYNVEVYDDRGASGFAEITLIQPPIDANPTSDSARIVYMDQSGALRALPNIPGLQPSLCQSFTNHWWSEYCGQHPYDIFNFPTAGNVGIGVVSVPAGFKLAVRGKIICEELKVKMYSAGWPDFVFKKDYDLMSLKNLASFIKENNRLPQMPSSFEIEKNNGIMIGDIQAKLLQKIEELTLYIIEQDKRIERLEKEVK